MIIIDWHDALARPSCFYTTQIPVCLWFMTKNTSAPQAVHRRPQSHFRDRQGETCLSTPATKGSMIRPHPQGKLDHDDISDIARTYHCLARRSLTVRRFTKTYPAL